MKYKVMTAYSTGREDGWITHNVEAENDTEALAKATEMLEEIYQLEKDRRIFKRVDSVKLQPAYYWAYDRFKGEWKLRESER